MSIGALRSTSSQSRVSRVHQPVCSYLIESPEVAIIGKYRWSLALRFSANTTVRILVTAHPLTNVVRIGGMSALGAS